MPHLDSVNDKPSHVNSFGDKFWYQNGDLHRDGDKPACEWADGTKYWYRNGNLHRDGDKPAIERADGDKEWYQNGNLHREGDKPACEYASGSKFWYQDGIEYNPNQSSATQEQTMSRTISIVSKTTLLDMFFKKEKEFESEISKTDNNLIRQNLLGRMVEINYAIGVLQTTLKEEN